MVLLGKIMTYGVMELSFSDPNSRLHKPELRSYACLIYDHQVIFLLSYLTVDKTISEGLN